MIALGYKGPVKLLVELPGVSVHGRGVRHVRAGSLGRVTMPVLFSPEGDVIGQAELHRRCEEGTPGFEIEIMAADQAARAWVYARPDQLEAVSPLAMRMAHQRLLAEQQRHQVPVVAGRPRDIWLNEARTQLATMSRSEAPNYRLVEEHPDGSKTCTCPRGRKRPYLACPHMRRYDALKAAGR